MADYTIVYWRDIPAQVIAKTDRRNQVKVQLTERFEKAIDRAAMRGGARDTDSYLAEWRKGEPVPCDNDIQAVARTIADGLEAEFDDNKLNDMVKNGGRHP